MSVGILMRTYKDGRLFIPIDVRRQLNISNDSLFEVFVDGEDIVLKRYYPGEKLLNALNDFKCRLDFEQSELDYNKVKEIEKRIEEIRVILEVEK